MKVIFPFAFNETIMAFQHFDVPIQHEKMDEPLLDDADVVTFTKKRDQLVVEKLNDKLNP